ncbi:MAG: cyclic nucleotide-binding domain-containing protein [Gammaproteobacteria bacterium]|nr:cyclic nucleotide-binding domain-containing protein [Gammaproteobacteria bacterium]
MRKVLFILGQMSDSDTAWLANNGQRQVIAKGTELIRQGSRINTMYFILTGVMSVVNQQGTKLAELGGGDILGEMSMLDSGVTAASVRADQDCTVLAIAKPALEKKLADDTAFAARFYRALALFLADRMRSTMRTLGYGEARDEVPTEGLAEDELDAAVLDNVHLAGARFERLLKQLAGG